MKASFRACLILAVLLLVPPFAFAVAPADAPPLTIPPPEGGESHPAMVTTADTLLPATGSTVSPWMILGVVLVIVALAGFIYIRRKPGAYIPKSRRLQK